jgi:hypothetical protein
MQTRNKAQASSSFSLGNGGGGIATTLPTNNSGVPSGVDASRKAKPSGTGPTIAGNAADDRYLNTRKRFLQA